MKRPRNDSISSSEDDAHRTKRAKKEPELSEPESSISNSSEDEKITKTSLKKEIDNDFEIDSDDEVFLLECPQNFKLDLLLNTPIDLATKTKIVEPSTNEKFIVNVENRITSSECLVSKGEGDEEKKKIICLPNIRHLSVTKRMKLRNDINIENINYMVPLPSKLILRHPLLGRNFKERIDEAAKRLKEVSKRERKKQKSL